MIQGTWIGIEKADAILNQLRIPVQVAIIRQGMRKAVKPTIAMAKSNAPVREGKLRKSIGSLNSRTKSGYPGLDTGARKKIAPHAHLVEFGTRGVVTRHKKNPKTSRRYKIGEQYRPPTAPNPFMRRAVEATRAQVMKTVGFEIGLALERKMKRVLR